MTYTRVESSSAVQQLAAGLHAADRDRPWVVVTSRFGSCEPDILVDQLTDDIGDVTRVFLLETGALTRELSELLPDRFQVYGGAGRSYPVGGDAFADLSRSKLRFGHGNARRATDQLVTDALAHAHQAGLFAQAPTSAIAVTGTVKGFLSAGSRALVDLADGGMATVWQELTYPPVALDWTLEPGQRIDGLLDVATRRLNIELETPGLAALAERFPHGSITLALVQHVSAQRAALALHPHVAMMITRPDISPNPLDKVDTLLSEGDVVAVRVVHLQTGALHLRLSDVDDDDEPVLPPLALVRNGPPWLRENRALVAPVEELPVVQPVETPPVETTPVETPPAPVPSSRPRPGPGAVHVVTAPVPLQPPPPEPPASGAALQSTQLSLAEAKARIARLEAQLADAGASDSHHARLREQTHTSQLHLQDALAELGALRHTAADLRDDQRTQKRMLRESRRTPAAVLATNQFELRREHWADAAGWVRHEIYLAWVDRVAPTDRAEWPLPTEYTLSNSFAESLAGLGDGQLSKAFKASVDVLTGLVKTLQGRQLHPLRQGHGPTAPGLVRSDGARCMRVAIEQNTAAARRLHYWQLPGGGIELARIVTHDDMEP